jgi:hypothetical protein
LALTAGKGQRLDQSLIFHAIPKFWLLVRFSRPHAGKTGALKSIANILAAHDLVRRVGA